MARENGKKARKRPRYFYLDGELHKVLTVNRGRDFVITWNYPQAKRKMYVWSDVQKRKQRAMTITEVAQLVNRHRMTIDEYIREGWIKSPQRTYNIETRRLGKHMFSEDDVMDLHDFMSERILHHGRRMHNDNLPSKAELRALVREGRVLYARDEYGDEVPMWKERV